MRTIRFPIAWLMVAVLVAALGLAALRNASEIWAGATFLLTCAVLCLAIVGVVCRGDGERAWWLGFALFGWGYLLLAIWSPVELPTIALFDAAATWLGVHGPVQGGMRGMRGGFQSVALWAGGFGGGIIGAPGQPVREIAHCLWALVAALFGGLLARTLFGGARTHNEHVEAHTEPPARTPRRWWLWPAVVWLAACTVIVALGFVGSRTMPGVWVGATYFVTCAVLGVTVLGAAGCRGHSRQVWFGAAVFGIGYMTLAFGRSLAWEAWPSLPTDHLLNAVRPWFPPLVTGFPTSSPGVAAANARIWQALQQPVPMHYPEDTPLEDVLKYVKQATTSATYRGIPIYVEPTGLQEAERSMTSTIRNIDLEGVALKTTLRLCLEQLELTYSIRDGFLWITYVESAVKPAYEDPFLIAGHCVLALLAAAVGGITAPLLGGVRRRS